MPYWIRSSSFDFCEQNYVQSEFIAEFFNTITSIPIVAVGLFGLIECWKARHATRFLFCYFTLLTAGLGSLYFHGTLHWAGQILDELSMIFCVQGMYFVLLSSGLESQTNSIVSENAKKYRKVLLLVFPFASLVFLWTYFFHPKQFWIFVFVYGAMVVHLSLISYNVVTKTSDRFLIYFFYVGAGAYISGFIFFW